jgi:hypothetical protein
VGFALEYRSAHWLQFFARPEHAAARRWARVVFLLLLFVAVPILLFWPPSLGARSAEGMIRGLPPAPFTAVERARAEEFLRNTNIFVTSEQFPIWDAPGDRGLFAVAAERPDRAILDDAITQMRAIEASRNVVSDASDDQIASQIEAVRARLGEVSQEQTIDRGVVLYHRAVLDLWRGDYQSPHQDLTGLLTMIDRLEPRYRSGAPRARIDGVRVATLYALGHANMRAGDPEAAITSFRQAIERADELERRTGLTNPGPFVDIDAGRHVVEMSTTRIWNDLLAAYALVPGSSARAIRDAAPLIGNPNYLQRDRTLAANLMILAVIQEGSDSVAERQRVVAAIGRALADAPDDAVTARAMQRANAARAIAGLCIDRSDAAGNQRSELRSIFARLYPGSTDQINACFPIVDIAGAQDVSEQLDAWLFIREWRRQIDQDRPGQFENSFSRFRGAAGNVRPQFFEAWVAEVRSHLRPQLLEYSRRSLTKEDRDRVFAALLACNNCPIAGQAEIVLRYKFGDWWPAWVALWIAITLFALWLLVLLEFYRRDFFPLHYNDRQLRKETRDSESG